MGRDFINSLLTQLHIEFQGKGVNYYYGYLCFNRLVLNERSRKTANWAFSYSGKCMMIVMQVRSIYEMMFGMICWLKKLQAQIEGRSCLLFLAFS